MRLKSWIFLVIILNLSVVLGANKISIELDKTVYPPFGELQGMCLLKLDRSLDLGFKPSIKLSIGNKFQEVNALDVLKDLDPNLDLQENSINLKDPESQKSLDLSSSTFFGLKLPKNGEVKSIEFDVEGVNNNGFPNSPFIDFNNDNKYEFYYAGDFNGWSNDVINAKGLGSNRSSEDLLINDNINFYCSVLYLPYSNLFNVSAEYVVDDNTGNISLQIFEFDSETNSAFGKKGECSLKNVQGQQTSNCVINTTVFLNGEHLVCFYNSKSDGSYLLSLDDNGEFSYECDSEILDQETECSYVQEGDFLIRTFKPIYQGQLDRTVKFSEFGIQEFTDDATDYLEECEEDENGECDILLKVGSSNNAGKVNLKNFKIEYSREGGASFISRRAYSVEQVNAKILGVLGRSFNNYSLEIPLDVFDNLTVPNISTNQSTSKVKVFLGNLQDEKEIQINKNILFSAQSFIDSAELKFDNLKKKSNLSDFYNVLELNFDTPINRMRDFETNLNTINSNTNLGISEKSEEVENILKQAKDYVKSFPKEIFVIESIDYPRVYPETISSEILGNEKEQEVLARQDEVEINSKIKVISVENFDGTISQKTFIKRTLEGSIDYFVFEDISKNVAPSTSSIKFSTGANIVKDDPIIKWRFNEDGEIAYVIDGNVLSKLDKINTVIVPFSEEDDTGEFKDSTCGDNVCTEILEDEVSCPEDCKAKYDINWLLIVVLIIILVLGIIYFNFFMNKRSIKEIVVKRAKFLSPSDEANLKFYMTKALEKGVPRVTIYKILLQKRWSKDQIDYVFKKVQPPESRFKFIFDLLKKK